MADLPILFSAPMVRALLDGRKTQTRRVLRPQPCPTSLFVSTAAGTTYDAGKGRPFGIVRYTPGDRLWVREAISGLQYAADFKPVAHDGGEQLRWLNYRQSRSPIHMPRWASRLTLLVTDVRVQRLQDITNADAVAEGIERLNDLNGFRDYQSDDPSARVSMRVSFQSLWNSINGPDAWDESPWVAAISFDVRHGNINQMESAS